MNTLEYQAAAENEKTKAIGMDMKKRSWYIYSLKWKKTKPVWTEWFHSYKIYMHNKLLFTSMGVEKYETVDEDFYFNFYNHIRLKVDLPIH